MDPDLLRRVEEAAAAWEAEEARAAAKLAEMEAMAQRRTKLRQILNEMKAERFGLGVAEATQEALMERLKRKRAELEAQEQRYTEAAEAESVVNTKLARTEEKMIAARKSLEEAEKTLAEQREKEELLREEAEAAAALAEEEARMGKALLSTLQLRLQSGVREENVRGVAYRVGPEADLLPFHFARSEKDPSKLQNFVWNRIERILSKAQQANNTSQDSISPSSTVNTFSLVV